MESLLISVAFREMISVGAFSINIVVTSILKKLIINIFVESMNEALLSQD